MIGVILIAGVIFYEAFVRLKALDHLQSIVSASKGSLSVIQSKTLSDEEKAAAMQKSSATVFKAVFFSTLKIAAAVGAALLFLFLVSLLAWPFEDILLHSVKPLPLVAVVAVLFVYGKIRHGRRA